MCVCMCACELGLVLVVSEASQVDLHQWWDIFVSCEVSCSLVAETRSLYLVRAASGYLAEGWGREGEWSLLEESAGLIIMTWFEVTWWSCKQG